MFLLEIGRMTTKLLELERLRVRFPAQVVKIFLGRKTRLPSEGQPEVPCRGCRHVKEL